MSIVRLEIRGGVYIDSVVLMQLQQRLRELPGVLDAALLMGTAANHQLLRRSGLWKPEAASAAPDDLLVAVRGIDAAAAAKALEAFGEWSRRRSRAPEESFRPRSIETALPLLPEARFAAISLPGRHAVGPTGEALERELHVFLYSDNVPLEEEVRLKRLAADRGLLLMGPDCGTSILNGIGFGFANRVSRGPIGLIGGSGTGLQAVSCMLHARGRGISHAVGTGGRDLYQEVGGTTTRQAFKLLAQDRETEVLVLISKPPDTRLAERIIAEAGQLSKPVVVALQGFAPPARRLGSLHFASTLQEAADLAAELSDGAGKTESSGKALDAAGGTFEQRRLCGLFSGGTLALETLQILRCLLGEVTGNLENERTPGADPAPGGHRLLDLGADEFTVGRPHPMLDQQLRIRLLAEAAQDPEVGVILLDVVLGEGSHPDPAAELGPAIQDGLQAAEQANRELEIIVLVVGSDRDPQGLERQISRLHAAGARVETLPQAAADRAARQLRSSPSVPGTELPAVDPEPFQRTPAVINLGLEAFAESLQAQGAQVVHVDWRPPAGGDSRLTDILGRLKRT